MRTERSFLKWQMVVEAISLIVSWILILLFVLNVTNIQQLVVLQGILGTIAVVWWMKWERARLPKEAVA